MASSRRRRPSRENLKNVLGNVQTDVVHFFHDPVSCFLPYHNDRLWHFLMPVSLSLLGPGPSHQMQILWS